ncbi:hypothetical protein T4E_8011 [Trichinella pseudospiralis]|uniref:Uncharacterized protein n=1 Tax=Trichinella pseudospiralis TaxID=6337 RepID=A0A0V0Y8P6_TRIPS|nr:hypothetical protein T4E_8011 [Trichinella pseudospiralis]
MQLIKRKLRTVFEHLHPNSSSEKAKQDRTNSMTMKRQEDCEGVRPKTLQSFNGLRGTEKTY